MCFISIPICRSGKPSAKSASSRLWQLLQVQLSTYDISKDCILRYVQVKDGVAIHFVASLLSGIAVTMAMQPFDIVAVRLMNQPHKECGSGLLYSGPVDCLKQMLEAEGVFGLYKGAAANYVRFGPYCTLTFVFLEQLRLAWDRGFSAGAGC